MTAIITLTTDFGLTDAYVAAMKGVMLGINPNVQLIDICHTIEPQNVLQGAFVLSTAHRSFPGGTIHLVVVDPEVGTERKGLVLKTPHACFVAPDNGVLTYVAREYSSHNGSLSPRLEAVELTSKKYWRPSVSPTFHGRDVFAPVAAHLSTGVPLIEFGEKAAVISVLSIAEPRRNPDGSLVGTVMHVDHFGNLITNVKAEDIAGTPEATQVEISGQRISGLSLSYAQSRRLLALIGSNGHLEIAVREGNASKLLKTGVGEEVKVTTLKRYAGGAAASKRVMVSW